MLKFKSNRNDNWPPIKVTRTTEGTVFEIAIAMLNIIMWGMIALIWMQLPELIPTHFNLAGRPDAYGDKIMILVVGGLGTVTSVAMCFCAYHPESTVNLPVRISNAAQLALVVRMVRIIGVLISLMFISIVWNIGGCATAGLLIIPITIAIFAVIAWYTTRIHRLK